MNVALSEIIQTFHNASSPLSSILLLYVRYGDHIEHYRAIQYMRFQNEILPRPALLNSYLDIL